MSNKKFYEKNFYYLKYYKNSKYFNKYLKFVRLKSISNKCINSIKLKMINELFEKGCRYEFRDNIYYFDGRNMIKVKYDGSLSKINCGYFREVWFSQFKKIEE